MYIYIASTKYHLAPFLHRALLRLVQLTLKLKVCPAANLNSRLGSAARPAANLKAGPQDQAAWRGPGGRGPKAASLNEPSGSDAHASMAQFPPAPREFRP